MQVGRRDVHLAVEPPRAQQRRIEILEPVGRAHDHDLVGTAEAVELDEQLVQRLVVLAVVGAAGACAPDRVELVDEDDRRRVLARLLEELADSGCSEPGEHLDERRCAGRVEVCARLVRGRLREQRLARFPAARRGEPLGTRAPSRSNFLRSRRNSTTSFSSSFASSAPATSPQPTGSVVSRSTIAGLTFGTSDIVRSSSQMMMPKKMIGSHVIRKPPMSSTEWGQVTTDRAIGRRARD